jgi:protein-disulfide isomerase
MADLFGADLTGLSRRKLALLGVAAGAVAACGGEGQSQVAEQAEAIDGSCTPAEPTRANAIRPVDLYPEDRILGSADALLTVIEYASVTCPHCAHFHEAYLPEIKRRYIDTGKMRLVFRELPTGPAPLAFAGFLMARCAPEDKYFDVLSLLFERQTPLIEAYQAGGTGARDELMRIARAMGISDERFETCIRDQAQIDRITQWGDEATNKYGPMSTPAFVVNGEVTFGALPTEDFVALISPYVGVAC